MHFWVNHLKISQKKRLSHSLLDFCFTVEEKSPLGEIVHKAKLYDSNNKFWPQRKPPKIKGGETNLFKIVKSKDF
ncbi:hypothetical protein BTA30_00840 [Bacillus swezeyi]|uniref:Uncharacterized protein n=1 Tax=Bacillus swezeyi TaxID=1925020 RepID=A0A1R1S3B8_9BACI|nr:hypothetical protein BW143_10205 [Bacillus swezeyi]OMI32785.1 hypothetical protein BTA30_00840 [Bacillus swezeyi]